jgi:hypothetical protein
MRTAGPIHTGSRLPRLRPLTPLESPGHKKYGVQSLEFPRRGTAKTAKSVAFQVCDGLCHRLTVSILRNLIYCVHNLASSEKKEKWQTGGLQSVTIYVTEPCPSLMHFFREMRERCERTPDSASTVSCVRYNCVLPPLLVACCPSLVVPFPAGGGVRGGGSRRDAHTRPRKYSSV